MHMDKLYLGVDFGGTKVNFTVMKGKEFINLAKIRTGSISSVYDIVDRVSVGMEKIGIDKIRAIGIGIAGMVDQIKGVGVYLTNLGKLTNVNLTDILFEKFGVPVFIDNDVDAALIAEKELGALRGIRNAVFISVGTGVGGGILIGGKIYIGKNGFAGEFGHITVRDNGLKCNCGKRGCLETESSGTGIERYVRNRIKKRWKTRIDKIEAKRIAAFAKSGDLLAIEAYQNAVHYLALTTGNLINIFNPEKVIFGGGVVESGLIVESVKDLVSKYALPAFLKEVKIEKSALKGNTGAIGAALLARDRSSGKNIYIY